MKCHLLPFSASERRWRSAIAAALALAAIGVISPSASVAATGSWTIATSPNAGTNPSYLDATACATVGNCWAVGHYYQGFGGTIQTLTEHYNGSAWSVVSSPNKNSMNTNLLSGVACVSTSSCWAAGYYVTSSGVSKTLIEHYDGSAWGIVSSPNAGNNGNQLKAVTCDSGTDCWAVGLSVQPCAPGPGPCGESAPLFEHYDGSGWSVVSTANPAGVGLSAITCVSASDCWAVGAQPAPCNSGGIPVCAQTLIEHYDGSAWTKVSSPNASTSANNLYGVSCAAANYCIAAGYVAGSDIGQTLILRYTTGTGWTIVTSPNPPNGPPELLGVSCSTAKFCVAAGYYNSASANGDQTLIEQKQLGGGGWTIAASPNAGTNEDNNLNAVTCTSGCFAVGDSNPFGTSATLIEQHAGDPTKTTVSCSPNPDVVGKPSKCTAQVVDTIIPLNTPTGSVSWSGGTGTFSSKTCTLSGGTCSVMFTPSAATTQTITGKYVSNTTRHVGRGGSTTLQVTQ